MNRQSMEGKWDQVKGTVKRKWGELTDDDLDKAEGDYDKLVGIIKERTGQRRELIEKRLEEMDGPVR